MAGLVVLAAFAPAVLSKWFGGCIRMWCRTCQQEVPGVADSAGPHFRCVRCRAVLLKAAPMPGLVASGDVAGLDLADHSTTASPLTAWEIEQWEVGQRLQHVQRVLDSLGVERNSLARLDAAHAASQSVAETRPLAETAEPKSVLRGAGWCLVALAVTAMGFGGALAGWGYTQQRAALSDWGLPVLLGAQAVLAAGLALLLGGTKARGR